MHHHVLTACGHVGVHMHVRVTWHIHNKVSSSRHTTPSTLAANSMGQRLLPTGRRRAPREPSRLTAPSSSPGDPGPQAACRPTRADGNWAAIRRTLAVLPSVRVLIPSTPLALAVHRHTNQTLSRSMSRAPRAREAASGVRCPQHQSPVWSAGGMGGLYTWAPHGDRTLCQAYDRQSGSQLSNALGQEQPDRLGPSCLPLHAQE